MAARDQSISSTVLRGGRLAQLEHHEHREYREDGELDNSSVHQVVGALVVSGPSRPH